MAPRLRGGSKSRRPWSVISLWTLFAVLAACVIASKGDAWIAITALYCASLANLISSASQLPDRVATHFRFDLQADGWMRRSTYLKFWAAFSLAFPLFFPIALLLSDRGNATLVEFTVWMACLLLGLVFGTHAFVVQANRRQPAKLSNLVWAFIALFLAGSFLLTLRL